MMSLALGVLWAALVVFVLLPASTMAARALLAFRRKFSTTETKGDWAFLLIVLPSLAPVVWFVAETLHESEHYLVGTSGAEAFCYDLVIASALLLGVFGAFFVRHALAEHRRPGEIAPIATERLRHLCRTNETLAPWSDHIVGTHGASHECATRGLLRPRIEIEASFLDQLDDAALAAVLLHEVEHLRRRDPLRNLIGHLCLSLNPAGVLLVPEWHRWRAERELRCDAAALAAQADPLSLAAAILMAARPRRTIVLAPLAGENHGLLKLRIQRLLEPVVELPESLLIGVVPPLFFAIELVLPHTLSSAPIQLVHNVALHPLLAALLT